MRPRGSPQFLEERRRRVVGYFRLKLSLHEIARRLGCHASSVLRWRNAWRGRGAAGGGRRLHFRTDDNYTSARAGGLVTC
jgi:transposase-like protein